MTHLCNKLKKEIYIKITLHINQMYECPLLFWTAHTKFKKRKSKSHLIIISCCCFVKFWFPFVVNKEKSGELLCSLFLYFICWKINCLRTQMESFFFFFRSGKEKREREDWMNKIKKSQDTHKKIKGLRALAGLLSCIHSIVGRASSMS